MEQRSTTITEGRTWDMKSVTVTDCSRIITHLYDDIGNKNVEPKLLHQLYLTISSGKRYYSENIPGDIVTMNSELYVLLNNREKKKIKIVYPEDAKSANDISIYSSLGAACIGAHENSTIHYNDNQGHNQVKIEKIIFQPEKEKFYYL